MTFEEISALAPSAVVHADDNGKKSIIVICGVTGPYIEVCGLFEDEVTGLFTRANINEGTVRIRLLSDEEIEVEIGRLSKASDRLKRSLSSER